MSKQLQDISFADLLPRSIKDDEQISSAALALDSEIQAINSLLDTPTLLPRLDELPEEVVDLLAWQFHVDFWEPDLGLERKRNLVRESVAWHKYKGTIWAVRQALIWAGFGSAEVMEHKQLVQSWRTAGGYILEGDWNIDGSVDLSAPDGEFRFMTSNWAEFAIRANAAEIELVPGEQERIRRMVDISKPARSHLVGLEFYALYNVDSKLNLSEWTARVESMYDKCGSAHVPSFQIIGWGCREIGGSSKDSKIDGSRSLSGWLMISGNMPDGTPLDAGHWGTLNMRLQAPEYTQTSGNNAPGRDTLDPEYKFLFESLDGSRDLSVQNISGEINLSGKLDLSVRPLTRQTYAMLDGSRNLGLIQGPGSVWHSGHVDWWHGNQHYREAI